MENHQASFNQPIPNPESIVNQAYIIKNIGVSGTEPSKTNSNGASKHNLEPGRSLIPNEKIPSTVNHSQIDELSEHMSDEESEFNSPSNSSKNVNKKRATTSDKDRETIIKYHKAKYNPLAIARIMELNFKTVQSIVNIYQKTGRVASLKRGGPQLPKLSEDQKEIIKSWIVDDCHMPLTKIKSKIQSEFNITVSTTTVFNIAKELEFTINDLREVLKQSSQAWDKKPGFDPEFP